MADLFQGQTMTEAYRFISGGAAYTFTYSFQPDLVIFNNTTDWTGTAGGIPRSFWFRDQTAAASSFQQQVIDSAAGASFNFLNIGTNGFTVADTSGGVPSFRATISAVSQADPCVVTTAAAHGYQTGQHVRITDLGSDMPTARGMDQINNNRYLIVVLSSTTFSLQDPVTGEDVDSTSFTAYVSGGRVNLETRVLALNNPQVSPYDVTPYVSNPFEFDPIEYKLTVGTQIMGNDGDEFLMEVFKWGNYVNLGDLGA